MTMARLGKVASWFAALGIVALVVWAFIKGVDKDPAVVGTVFTAVAGIVVVVYQRRREKHQELERSHREQMSPIYQQLVETLKDVGEKEDGANVSFFKDLATKMLLYGPTPVVKAWIEWHRTGVSDDPSNLAGMLAWEKVLFAMREDLGHDNSGLKTGDLLRIYVNDIDELLPAWLANQATNQRLG
jgi:hypothetical protein